MNEEKLKLEQIRKNLDMTQEEMAHFLGVSRNYISMIERGTKPFPSRFRRKVTYRCELAELERNRSSLGNSSLARVEHSDSTKEECRSSWYEGQIAAFERTHKEDRARIEELAIENAELKRQLDCANQKLADLREARGAPPMASSAPDAQSAS